MSKLLTLIVLSEICLLCNLKILCRLLYLTISFKVIRMKKKVLYIIATLAVLVSGVMVMPTKVYAIDFSDGISVCDFVGPLCDALQISGVSSADVGRMAMDYVKNRASLILSVVFVGIILIAVYIIIRAGITYISSQGKEEKIQEAQKAIKNVFIGIVVMFVGIVGIILVLAFFGGVGLIQSSDGGCTIEPDGTVKCD
jgi:hypothetical protein